jgi:hypothetical protein
MSLGFLSDSLPTSAPASQLGTIPSGIAGVRTTLKLMVQLARRAKTHALIRETAKGLVGSCPEKNLLCEVTQLQHFVRDQIRYIRDVHDVETLQTPDNTLTTRQGDCDDKASLLASLLLAIGIPAAFCALGVRGGPYSHVMAEAILRTRKGGVQYVPCETIIKIDPATGTSIEPGWFPPDATCMMVAHI